MILALVHLESVSLKKDAGFDVFGGVFVTFGHIHGGTAGFWTKLVFLGDRSSSRIV